MERKMEFEKLADLNPRLQDYRRTLFSALSVDFGNFIFLGLRGRTTKNLEDVLKKAASRDGYVGHKAVLYRPNIVSHFYIQFRSEICAEKAIVYFRALDNKFNADIVKNILLTWYMIEKVLFEYPHPTTVYVDSQDETDNMSLLSTNNIETLLRPYRNYRILESNESCPTFIQVDFLSMAEALAATIAVGDWYFADEIQNCLKLNYRMRIVGNRKEVEILECAGTSAQEALKFDYFVSASEEDEPESPYEYSERPIPIESQCERELTKTRFRGRGIQSFRRSKYRRSYSKEREVAKSKLIERHFYDLEMVTTLEDTTHDYTLT